MSLAFNNKEDLDKVSAAIKVAACICARDGLISQAEETVMFQLVSEKYLSFTIDFFNIAIDDFFNSENQIEDYLECITDLEMRKFTLFLSKKSASADGLDFRENIAIQKASFIWGIELNE